MPIFRRSKSAIACVLLVQASAACPQAAPDTNPAERGPAMEQIVVVGKRPGPPLWRVSNGENELFIFGMLSPLPKGMEWQSTAVESVIADADEFLTEPHASRVRIGINPFRIIRLVNQLRRVSRNPDDARLAEVVPADLYARFAAQKSLYMPRNNNIEKLRPWIAANMLYSEALDDVGLTGDDAISSRINRLVKRNKRIKVTDVEVGLNLNFKALTGEIDKFMEGLSPEAERACLDARLRSLETDIGGMQARAAAWAFGSVNELRYFDYPNSAFECEQVVTQNTGSDAIERVIREGAALWLEAVDRALTNNRTTFAVLSVQELLREGGLLDALRARGYDVREP